MTKSKLAALGILVGASTIVWSIGTAWKPRVSSGHLDSRQPAAPPADAQRAGSLASVRTSAPTEAVKQFWGAAIDLSGEGSGSSAYDDRGGGRISAGRFARFEANSVDLNALSRGTAVAIPMPDGSEQTGRVNLVQTDSHGTTRIGGSLIGDVDGSFSLAQSGAKIAGRILDRSRSLAYIVSSTGTGTIEMHALPLSSVICYPMPRDELEPERAPAGSGPVGIPPELQSRPGASAVLYLDFDGETVTDPNWNSGETIIAAAPILTNAQMTEVWYRVKEDFWPFNINVTTVRNDYESAAVGTRMRVIVTGTHWDPSGGIAYLDSLTRAGDLGFTDDIPCWVFNTTIDGIAEAISHELGHTLGLSHDTNKNAPGIHNDANSGYQYYTGHGSGALSWGPIMGAAYSRNIVQWSKGEYAEADNFEDDIAIISGAQPTPLSVATNPTGYVPDDAGDSRGTATAWNFATDTVTQDGTISSPTDTDYYSFSVSSTTYLTLHAEAAAHYPKEPNLDTVIELQDASGTLLATSNPDQALNGVITYTLGAGTYYVSIRGTGRANPATDGYSNYGSIGQYSILAELAQPTAPVFTDQPQSRSLPAGTSSTQFTVVAAGIPPPTYQWQRQAAGSGSWVDLATGGYYGGTTTQTLTVFSLALAMNGDQFRCRATNIAGTAVSNAATLSVNPVPPTITGQPHATTVPQNQTGTFSVSFEGTPPVTIKWFKDGVEIAGATQTTLAIVNVQPSDEGVYTVMLSSPYGSATSSGATLTVNRLPVITTQPSNVSTGVGNPASFSVAAQSASALSYQWRKNRQPITGAVSSSYSIAHVSESDAGNYDVVVTNTAGSTTSFPGVLTVFSGLNISSSIPPRQVLEPGQSLILDVTASGSGSLGYQWIHNGRAMPGQNAATLAVGNVTKADGGWYVARVSDSAGTRNSAPFFVTVAPLKTELRAWGLNSYGALDRVTELDDIVAFDVAESKIVAIRRDGTVAAWGYQYASENNIPAGLDDAVAIAATPRHILILRSNGTVVSLGTGYTQPPADLNNVVAVAGSESRSMALKSDGTVVVWDFNGTPPSGPTDVVEIAACGGLAYAALKNDGTVVMWNVFNNLISVPTGLAGVVDISAGPEDVAAIKSDGAVVIWGNDSLGIRNVPSGLSQVVDLSISNHHVVALKADGTIVAWGVEYSGEFTPPPGLAGLMSVGAGSTFSLALRDATGDQPPVITTQPSTHTALEGESFVLSVAADSSSQLLYQWRKDGSPIAGATGPTLSFPELTVSDSGSYDVLVSNAEGMIASNVAVLTVYARPVVTRQSPTRTVLEPGQPLQLTATATGSGTLHYQWLRNGVPIPGATLASLNLASVTVADSGWYLAEVSDQHGPGRSAAMFVRVTPAITQARIWGDLEAVLPYTDLVDFTRDTALRKDGTLVATDVAHGGSGVPQNVADVVQIGSYGNDSIALRSDGRVFAWHLDNYRNANAGTDLGLENVVAISAGGTCVALLNDGTVRYWGPGSTTIYKLDATDVIAVAGGGLHAMALKSDGTVIDWGFYAEYTQVPSGLSGAKEIAAGYVHSLAALQDGTVVAWGYSGDGATAVPPDLSDVVSVSGGQRHSLALRADGTVAGWGWGAAASPPSGMDHVFAIFAGYLRSAVLRDPSDDSVPIITSHPTNITRAELGQATFTVSVTGNGPFAYQWRKNGVDIVGATQATLTLSPLALSDAGSYDVRISNAVGSVTSAVATLFVNTIPAITLNTAKRTVRYPGQSLTLEVSATGTGALSYQWFHNSRPISGATTPSLPIPSLALADAGYYFVKVSDSNGTRISPAMFVIVAPPNTRVVAWGRNESGETDVPTDIGHVVAVSAGTAHSLALRADGTVAAFGLEYAGRLSPPAGLTGVVAVAAGGSISLALREDGTVVQWGYEYAPIPTGLKDVVAIAAGNKHAVALKTDGTVVAWGNNEYGQISFPSGLSDVVAIAVGSNYNAAVKLDGSLVRFGQNSISGIALNISDIRSVSLTDYSGLALAWNHGFEGWANGGTSLAPYPSSLNDVIAVEASYQVSLALRADGSLVSWTTFQPPYNASSPQPPAGLTDLIAISAGDGFALALQQLPGSGNPPTLASQPLSQQVGIGGEIVLSITATSDVPLSYQWQRDGIDIAGATGSTLTLPARGIGNTGSFTVRVSNTFGTVTSNAATVSIAPSTQRSIWLMNGADISSANDLGEFDPNWQIVSAVSMNGDTKPDILWQNVSTGERYLWLMDGFNHYGDIDLGLVGPNWSIVTATDYNGDGDPDFLWQNIATGECYVWLMHQTEHFGDIDLGTVAIEWSMAAAADFNHDGIADILWENTSTGERSLWLMGWNTPLQVVDLGTLSTDWSIVAAADFNHDGHPDIYWENTSTGERLVWLMSGTTHYADVDLGIVDPAWDLASVADFNSDGQLDLTWEVYPVRTIGSDFNRDGIADVVWQNASTGERYLWMLHKTERWGEATLPTRGTDWEIAAEGDFNLDGRPDLIWQNTATGEREIQYMEGWTPIGSHPIGVLGTNWVIRSTADFSADGKPDILWQNTATGNLYLWLMDGTSHYGDVDFGNQALSELVVGAADFNHDGFTDIVWQNTSTGHLHVWLMRWQTFLSDADLGTAPVNETVSAVADYNRDGKPDLLLTNSSTGNRHFWILDGFSKTNDIDLATLSTTWRITR